MAKPEMIIPCGFCQIFCSSNLFTNNWCS